MGSAADCPFPPRGYAASGHIPAGTEKNHYLLRWPTPFLLMSVFQSRLRITSYFLGEAFRDRETPRPVALSAPHLGSRNVSAVLPIPSPEQAGKLRSCEWESTQIILLLI